MKKLLFLTFPFLLSAQTSFITLMEYASQLYKNPRGIGCQHCHGDKGEGKLIAKYVHEGEKKTFEGPAINHLEFDKFQKNLNKRVKGMPRYFLTIEEVKALYLYVYKEDSQESKKVVKNAK